MTTVAVIFAFIPLTGIIENDMKQGFSRLSSGLFRIGRKGFRLIRTLLRQTEALGHINAGTGRLLMTRSLDATLHTYALERSVSTEWKRVAVPSSARRQLCLERSLH